MGLSNRTLQGTGLLQDVSLLQVMWIKVFLRDENET
jgi:hypothetical protein